MRKTFFFDYIFYKITKVYLKEDSESSFIGSQAIFNIAIMQSCLVGAACEFAINFFPRNIFLKDVDSNFILFCFITILLFGIINYVKYKGKYELFDNYWKNEKKKIGNIKGICVFASIIFSWVGFCLVLIYFRHN